MKAIKTFKIGEYCAGGVITVEITGKVIQIFIKAWDFSAGSTKSSNQDNAEVLTKGTILTTESDARRQISNFLELYTTYYWAGEVLKWIESKVELEPYKSFGIW